jgi:hypothetical protein
MSKIKSVYRSRLFLPAFIIAIVLLSLWRVGLFNPKKPGESVREIGGKAVDVLTGGGGFSVDENTPGYENYRQLSQGCPFKDCISSIDDPKFESVEEADDWLRGDDVVFGLDYKGEQRAYPQRILNWHEIVNEKFQISNEKGEIEELYIAVTFCPLCGSTLAFDRRVDGQMLEFGVSGKLHNNDLVMYDRQTESLWQQITGEAIVGELFGKRLKPISMETLRWREWKELHPETKVLSRDTGYSRDYDRYPYGSYEQSSSVSFPIEGGVDATVHPKTVVYGIEVGDSAAAYPEELLQADADGVVADTVGGQRVRIKYDRGSVTVENLDAGEEVVATRLFWFAWKAFHPRTELYQP